MMTTTRSGDHAPQPGDALADALTLQGGYYVATGVLPFVSRRAFEAFTGPKLDWWLVETVGALVTVIGGALLSAAHRGNRSPELLAVAYGSATALAAIDIVYVTKRRIAPAYLVDAAVQIGLIARLARANSGRSRPSSPGSDSSS